MNDDRGPLTGPPAGLGGEPPDSAPRTEPPTEPVLAAPAPAALPTVLAVPEAPGDTPVFVAAGTVSASAAFPAAFSVLDMPTVTPAVAPAAAPIVALVAPAPPAAPAHAATLPPAPPPMPTRPPRAAAVMAPPLPPLTVPPRAPAEIASPPPRSRSLWPGRLRRVALILAGIAIGYATLVLTLIVAYRWIDPPRSALMIATHLSGDTVLYAPVPITSISSYLQRAVVTSEDARFCDHHGVDWAALFEAMNESRGGSTITMQTAKNLFLWNSRSYVRKAIEIPVALTIDALWPKRRILEVYLNIAEWGPGIFGAEAAAYYHFNKPASRLTASEAALLAASLPNPIARDAGEPGRVTSVLASRLRGRMASSDYFVHCLGLRGLPRPQPQSSAGPTTKPAARPALEQRPAAKAEPQPKPWQTTTEPAFNPWKDWRQY